MGFDVAKQWPDYEARRSMKLLNKFDHLGFFNRHTVKSTALFLPESFPGSLSCELLPVKKTQMSVISIHRTARTRRNIYSIFPCEDLEFQACDTNVKLQVRIEVFFF